MKGMSFMPIDQKNVLDENPFDYRIFKDNKLEITWNDKPVMMLKGTAAAELIRKLEKAEGKEVQLILAKVTGNFKRGNEKLFKKS